MVDVSLAYTVVTISIILSGIMLGLGKAFGNRKLESFGKDELFQSIINGALVGGLTVLIAFISDISTSASPNRCLPGADLVGELSCSINALSTDGFALFNNLNRALNVIGYYQTLEVNFGSFKIQPFINLEGVSHILFDQLHLLVLSLNLLSMQQLLLQFISTQGIALVLSLGLILRSFFATRKIGGFLVSLSIGLILFYPAFVSVFEPPSSSLAAAKNTLDSFNANPSFATVPIIDLNSAGGIAARLDNLTYYQADQANSTNMTGVDFSGELGVISQAATSSVSSLLFYSSIVPLLSLILTFVFIKELSGVLGSELFIEKV